MDQESIGVIRQNISERPLRQFDDLDANTCNDHDYFKRQIRDIVENGWERWNHKLSSLQPPLPWHEKHGSFDYSLHSWEPLRSFLYGYSHIGDESYFELPLLVAEDWLRQNFIEGCDAAIEDREDDCRRIDDIINGEPSACWYDMAVGQRIFRLAYILDVAARIPRVPDDLIGWLYRALVFHHRLLSREDFFVERNNHGIYQALGQLAAARRFAWLEGHEQYKILALSRVNKLFDRHFFDSGMHKEHSPGYHYMILGSFRGAAASGLFDGSPDLTKRLHKMEHSLAWMIQPNGWLLTMGDSDPRQLALDSSIASRFGEDSLRYILSSGKVGNAPKPEAVSYLDAGYAFARVYAPDVEPKFENASYLAQQSGFHSRTHKHADHFSFVWYDRNREILIDPGRYAYTGRTEKGSDLFKQGFWYSDPKRIYVESTRAHNCVEIDGKSYPRAGVKPFGSALKYAGEQSGLVVTECEVTHFRSIRHWRGIIMSPGNYLIVIDWLYDRTPHAKHIFRQWFKFHPDWQIAKQNTGWSALSRLGDSSELTMCIASLLPDPHMSNVIRGQDNPDLQGWMSDKPYSLVPAPCLYLEQSATALAQFSTVFTFSKTIKVYFNKSRTNKTMRKGCFVWEDDCGLHTLKFSRSRDKHMVISIDSERL